MGCTFIPRIEPSYTDIIITSSSSSSSSSSTSTSITKTTY